MDDQYTADISELVQRHQGKSDDSNFTSLLSNFSILMDFLKLIGHGLLN